MLLRLLPVDTPGVHTDSTLESGRDTPAVAGQASTRDQLLRLYDTATGWVQQTSPLALARDSRTFDFVCRAGLAC